MSAAELAQYRLQQIRAIENQQVVEQANVELKKQLEALKSTDNTKDVKEKLIKLAGNVKSWLSKMRLELEQTKGFCELQNNQILFLHQTIKDTLINMAGASNSQSGDVLRLQNENSSLARELREAQKSLRESQKSNAALTEKNKSLSAQYDACERDKTAFEQDCASLRKELEGQGVAYKELRGNFDAAQIEIIHLKKKIAKLEAAGGEALQAAFDAQQAAAEESAILIASLRRENEDHRANIINLKLHIERLTNAISGNKSHFAKFVELKTENAVLHNHLNNVLGEDSATTKQNIQRKVQQIQQQQAPHQQQQRMMPNPASNVAIPGITKSALNAVDPSLVDYHDTINNYIAGGGNGNGGGKGGGRNKLPASGLKPNQPRQPQQQGKAVINSARAGYTSGVVGTSTGSSGTSPRYATSMDDGELGVQSPGGGEPGDGGGGMFPRVATLNVAAGSAKIRRPSPITRNDGAAIGINQFDAAMGSGEDSILQHALLHQQQQQMQQMQQQQPHVPMSGNRKVSSKVRPNGRPVATTLQI